MSSCYWSQVFSKPVSKSVSKPDQKTGSKPVLKSFYQVSFLRQLVIVKRSFTCKTHNNDDPSGQVDSKSSLFYKKQTMSFACLLLLKLELNVCCQGGGFFMMFAFLSLPRGKNDDIFHD